jgi:hypothetical protein
MKKIWMAVAIAVSFHLTTPAQTKVFRLSDMSWLTGCWESRDDKKQRLVTEQWMKPAGGMMLGMGRTVADGRAADFEFLRIEQNGDGLVYIAKPRANKEETRFKMIRSGASEAIFENPEHDFPQRVIYRREGAKLSARIEGNRNGKVTGIDFPMTRVSCD